jgi:hypothetical protein
MPRTTSPSSESAGALTIPVPNAVYRPDIDVSQVDERKLMRKVDLHVIPWLTVLYLFSFLDRGSIGNAKLYDLETDLNITDRQYLLCLSMFFIPYALFEASTHRTMPLFVD